MGWASRINPRSLDSGATEREALEARVRRFCEFFQTREEFDDYLLGRNVTDSERAYLESMLPMRLHIPQVVLES